MPLTTEQIKELLAVNRLKIPQTKAQVGPLRFGEKAVRCAKRGCGVQTNYRVQGVPYCTVHSLEELNEMLVMQGFKGIVTANYKTTPTELPAGRIINASTKYKLDVGWSLGNFECIHGINLTKECNGCHG